VAAYLDFTVGHIKIQRIDANGNLILSAIDVADAPSNPGRPDVIALANGGFLVAWEDSDQPFPDSSSAAVRAQFFQANGDEFGVEFTVNSTGGLSPRLEALPDGGFVAIYSSSLGIGAQFFDPTGGRVGPEFMVNTTSSGTETNPDIAVLADGRVVVTWEDDSQTGNDTSSHAVRMQIIDPGDGVITGTNADNILYGNDLLNDEINGLFGDDTLIGMAGADYMYGGEGNDSYVVDNPGDRAIELLANGTDTVLASVSFALAANVENLILTGAGKINATGNALANVLTGNAAANVLTGGLAKDTKIGGGGADRFDFNAIAESAVGAANRDAIVAFSHAQHDRVDLATIDADQRAGHAGNQAFVFIGGQSFTAFHAAHPTVFAMVRSAGGLVEGNVNANLAADFQIGVGGAGSLTAADFIL
jgi:Ca2+-binding RTX toxin-like protein